MPSDPSDVAKFVRGAMLVFPELYFARFVILVEGDSERVVLPRLAEAEGIFSIHRLSLWCLSVAAMFSIFGGY